MKRIKRTCRVCGGVLPCVRAAFFWLRCGRTEPRIAGKIQTHNRKPDGKP